MGNLWRYVNGAGDVRSTFALKESPIGGGTNGQEIRAGFESCLYYFHREPTGLDVWLKGCDKNDTEHCYKGYVGSWDKDHKHFTRTHLSGDLTDSATLDRRGVTVKYNGGTYQGVWDTNKGENNAAQVAGAGALKGFTATINGNCSNKCVVSGFLSINGNNAVSEPAMSALSAPGSGYRRNAGLDFIDVLHKSNGSLDINFRGYLPDDPEGLPSTHVAVPNQAGKDVGFHVDSRYPYEDAVGFAEHSGSVVKTIIQAIAPPKSPQ